MSTTNFFYPSVEKNLKIVTMESLKCQVKIDQEEVDAHNDEFSNLVGVVGCEVKNEKYFSILETIEQDKNQNP